MTRPNIRLQKDHEISFLDAQRKIVDRLWQSDDSRLLDEQKLHITLGRIWRALREGRLRLYENGEPLELTDKVRFQLRNPGKFVLKVAEFDAWAASVSDLTKAPSAPFSSLIEAVTYLVFKAFLTKDDVLDSGIGDASEAELQQFQHDWQTAAQKVFDAHSSKKIILRGRLVSQFGAEGDSQHSVIPEMFFIATSDRRIELGLNGGTYNRLRSSEAFNDVVLSELDLKFIVSLANKTTVHAPTKSDRIAIEEFARNYLRKFGQAPSEGEFCAKFKEISRNDMRRVVNELPREYQRGRGSGVRKKLL